MAIGGRELALGTLSPSFASAKSMTSHEPLCGVGCNPVSFRPGPESSTEVLLRPGLLAFCVQPQHEKFKIATSPSCKCTFTSTAAGQPAHCFTPTSLRSSGVVQR